MNYSLALSLVLILSVSAAAQGTYEQQIATGLSNIEKKDYDAAEEIFRSVLKERPEDYKATLYLGIVLSRKGMKEGESLLKKALMMNPQDPEPNLQLGLYYFNKSVYPEAKDYFETTIELAPDTRYAAISKDHINRMNRSTAAKPWRIDAAVGGQYDSNVILGPGNMPLPEGISRKSDWSTVGYLKGEVDIVAAENFTLTPSYSIYQNLHAKLSDFNVTSQVAGVEARFALSPAITLKGAYAFEYIFVGGNGYDSAHTLAPAVVLTEGKGVFTTFNYSYRKTHFMNDTLFPDNSDRSGSDNLVGITQQLPIGNALELKAGYAYDNESAQKDFWAYRGNKGFANLTLKLLPSFSVDLYGEYYDQRYRAVNPAWSESARHDKMQTYSLTFAKKLSERFSVVLGQLYVRNRSNIEEFDYKRAITSLFLTARF